MGDGGGNSVGGDCVGLCQCEGDDIGGMPLGMMMKGDAVGVGKEGMTWGACRHRASTFSQTHMDTSTDKGDPSLGFAVTPAPGAPCGQCRALADRGHYLGVIILCMFSNCKLSQIKCIEFRNIKHLEWVSL